MKVTFEHSICLKANTCEGLKHKVKAGEKAQLSEKKCKALHWSFMILVPLKNVSFSAFVTAEKINSCVAIG